MPELMLACMFSSSSSIWPGSRCRLVSIQCRTCWRKSSGTPAIRVITSTGNGAGEVLHHVEAVRVGLGEVVPDEF